MKIKEFFRGILHPKTFILLVGVKNAILPSQAFIEAETDRKNAYDFYKRFLKKGDLVFDVGANFGNRVKVFIKLETKVVAVEPQKECTDFIKAVYGKKAIVIQKGVGAMEGVMDFYVATHSTLSSFSKDWIDKIVNSNRFEDNLWRAAVKIPVTTLEHLISQYGQPSFIKIDVEGFEWQVLQGLRTPVKLISLEYAVPENIQGLQECLSYLGKLGNYVINFSMAESFSLRLEQWLSVEDFQVYANSPDFLKTNAGDIYAKYIG